MGLTLIWALHSRSQVRKDLSILNIINKKIFFIWFLVCVVLHCLVIANILNPIVHFFVKIPLVLYLFPILPIKTILKKRGNTISNSIFKKRNNTTIFYSFFSGFILASALCYGPILYFMQ